MIPAGKYLGRLIGYGMRKTKKGDLSPTMKFVVTHDEGKQHAVFWQKNFATTGLTSSALKELVICGLTDMNDFQYIADGIDSNVLDTEREVLLTIEHETRDGKTYPKVAWVNDPSDERDPNAPDQFAITREQTAALLETVDLQAAFDKAFAAVNKGKEVEIPALY